MTTDVLEEKPIIVYEAHVTIEPVYGAGFDLFEKLSTRQKFKPAELLLQKQRKDTPIRSSKDSFCAGHSKTYDDIYTRMMALVDSLKKHGFAVWRYKIEGVVFDKREERLFSISVRPLAA